MFCSANIGPTICNPIGRPSTNPQGTEAAGWRVRLNGHVNGVQSNHCGKARGVGRVDAGSESGDGNGRRQQEIVILMKRLHLLAQRAHLGIGRLQFARGNILGDDDQPQQARIERRQLRAVEIAHQCGMRCAPDHFQRRLRTGKIERNILHVSTGLHQRVDGRLHAGDDGRIGDREAEIGRPCDPHARHPARRGHRDNRCRDREWRRNHARPAA